MSLETIPKLLLHISLGSLLLYICIWFGKVVYGSYRSNDMPADIRPFEITGVDETNEKKKVILARLLSIQLKKLEQDMRRTKLFVDQTRTAAANPQSVAPVDLEFLTKPVDLPSNVFAPLNVEMKVAEVEVGKLVGWLYDWLKQNDGLQLTAHYGTEQVTVAGTWGDDDGSPIWLKMAKGEDIDLIEQIAYAIAQKEFAKRVPETEFLPPEKFGDLLNVLFEVAQLGVRSATGVSSAEYQTQFEKLEVLMTGNLPQWRSLVRATAELAERADLPDKALLYYTKELSLMPKSPGNLPDDPKTAVRRQWLGTKIANLSEQILPSILVAGATDAENPVESFHKKVRSLIGVQEVTEQDKVPVIGIVGAAPPAGSLPQDQLRVVQSKSGENDRADDALRSYTMNTIEAIRIVTPTARFVVADVTFSSVSDLSQLRQSLGRLVEAVSPEGSLDVVLFPFGPLDETMAQTLEKITTEFKIPIVLAAGNNSAEKPPFSGTPRQSLFAIAASCTLEGLPTGFASRDKNVLWLPGEDIPFKNTGHIQVQSGSGYSAALLAGVVGRLKAARPMLSPQDLVKLLHDTSKSVSTEPEAVKAVNLDAALAASPAE